MKRMARLSRFALLTVLLPGEVAGLKTKSALLTGARNLLARASVLPSFAATGVQKLAGAALNSVGGAASAVAANPFAYSGYAGGLVYLHGLAHHVEYYKVWDEIDPEVYKQFKSQPVGDSGEGGVVGENVRGFFSRFHSAAESIDLASKQVRLYRRRKQEASDSLRNTDPEDKQKGEMKDKPDILELLFPRIVIDDILDPLKHNFAVHDEEKLTVAKDAIRAAVYEFASGSGMLDKIYDSTEHPEPLFRELWEKALPEIVSRDFLPYACSSRVSMQAKKSLSAEEVTESKKAENEAQSKHCRIMKEIIFNFLDIKKTPSEQFEVAVNVARKKLGEHAQQWRLGYREAQIREYLKEAESMHNIAKYLEQSGASLTAEEQEGILNVMKHSSILSMAPARHQMLEAAQAIEVDKNVQGTKSEPGKDLDTTVRFFRRKLGALLQQEGGWSLSSLWKSGDSKNREYVKEAETLQNIEVDLKSKTDLDKNTLRGMQNLVKSIRRKSLATFRQTLLKQIETKLAEIQ